MLYKDFEGRQRSKARRENEEGVVAVATVMGVSCRVLSLSFGIRRTCGDREPFRSAPMTIIEAPFAQSPCPGSQSLLADNFPLLKNCWLSWSLAILL